MIRTLCLIALAAIATDARSGTVLEAVNKNVGGDGSSTTMLTQAQGGMLRVEAQPGDTSMVFKDDTIYVLNHSEKSYMVMDRASMKKMAQAINPALKMLQEQMANMSPEQRAQMEQMMGGTQLPGTGKQPVQEIRKTSRSGKVGAYSCNYVEILQDGVLSDELCVAAPKSLQGADELMLAAEKMSVLLKDMMADIDAPWLKQMIDDQTANFAKLGGIPVISRHYSGGKPSHENTLKSIRTGPVPATAFAVPAGYTRKDMMPQQ